MSEQEDKKIEELKEPKVKDNKCPEYILRNARKYYAKKTQDPEFVEKERARIKAYREANRSHINELARLRRQKKKDEIQSAIPKPETTIA
jgi:hypothetical protein